MSVSEARPRQIASISARMCRAAFVLTLWLGIATGALADKVYKWVDQDGNVHFGDQPSSDTAQELEIRSKASPPAAAPSRVPGPSAPNTNGLSISDVMEEERLRRKKARAREKQVREERMRNCLLARDRLRSYEESNLLYDIDSSGKRRILSDAERNAAEREARAEIEHFCG